LPNDTRDLRGRLIPARYLAGLPPALQRQRIDELTASRDRYAVGRFGELPTDRTARRLGIVKPSPYMRIAKRRGIEWRGDASDMARRVLAYYGAPARHRDAVADLIERSYDRGLAAWQSGGHRPGATAQQWARARVASLVVGGKTSTTGDRDLHRALPARVQTGIRALVPEVYLALAGT